MNEKEKELELLKTKIEYLKLLTFILITIGTAFFTLIFWIYGRGEVLLKYLLAITSVIFLILLIRVIILDKKISNQIGNLEEKDV